MEFCHYHSLLYFFVWFMLGLHGAIFSFTCSAFSALHIPETVCSHCLWKRTLQQNIIRSTVQFVQVHAMEYAALYAHKKIALYSPSITPVYSVIHFDIIFLARNLILVSRSTILFKDLHLKNHQKVLQNKSTITVLHWQQRL